MARGINKVIIVGNLGQDPETRYMPSGGAVTNISIATSEGWKDKQTGQPQERTEWHRVVFFNKLAEIAGQYLKKGSKVYVEGSLRTRKWQGQDGQDRYTTEIVANEMQMLDSRGGGGGDYPSQDQGGWNQQAPQQSAPAPQGQQQPAYQPPPQQQSTQQPPPHAPQQQAPQQPASAPAPAKEGFADFDDDIPF